MNSDKWVSIAVVVTVATIILHLASIKTLGSVEAVPKACLLDALQSIACHTLL